MLGDAGVGPIVKECARKRKARHITARLASDRIVIIRLDLARVIRVLLYILLVLCVYNIRVYYYILIVEVLRQHCYLLLQE